MKFGVLGPLMAEEAGLSAIPSAPKQRQLLALLLFNSGQVVLVGTCIDEIWDESPPESARSTLQTYVLGLRKGLSRVPGAVYREVAHDRLMTRNGGYSFVVKPGDELDLDEFRRLAKCGREALRAGEYARAAGLLGSALDVWHGSAIADVTAGPVLSTYITGLEEQRIGVLEQRIEADLRIGRHHELLGELAELVARHPLNENIHAQFMLALYRSGRPARALQIFHELRMLLRREVGIDPSLRIRALHEAILMEDPILQTAPPSASASKLSLDLLSFEGANTVPIDSRP